MITFRLSFTFGCKMIQVILQRTLFLQVIVALIKLQQFFSIENDSNNF